MKNKADMNVDRKIRDDETDTKDDDGSSQGGIGKMVMPLVAKVAEN